MARILALAGILAAAAAGSSSAASPTVELKVSVGGDGTVVSKPGGIRCPSACSARVRKGARVALTARPNGDATFSHWSAPCAGSARCTVVMSRARTLRAFFTTPKPPPPPPAPPPPRAGHYVGNYTDGTFFDFDVQDTTILNFYFDYNGDCSNGGTSYDTGTGVDAQFPLQADGSFSGTATQAFSDSAVDITVSGTVSAAGAASGSLSVDIRFSDGTSCTSKGTWTAQDQS